MTADHVTIREVNTAGTTGRLGVHVEVKTHPDGGWGWVVCIAAFFIQFLVLGMQNCSGIVYTALVDDFQTDRGATAWVGSLATGMMFFLGPLTTSLCERFGCRIVTIIGALFCITGLLLSSFASSLPVLYMTYGMTWGTGTSLCYFPTLISLSKYFKKRLALVNGIVTSGSGVGTLILGPLVQIALKTFGVAKALRIFAGVFVLVVMLGCTFRPVSIKYTQYRQEKTGKSRNFFDCSIFRNKGYIVWTGCMATFMVGYFVPFVHLVRHAEDLGIHPTKASFLIGYMSVSSTVGRLFFGKLADCKCLNRMHIYQFGFLMISLSAFLLPLATDYVGLVLYSLSFGFFEGCYVVLIPVLVNDIVGPSKMSYGLGGMFTVMAFPMMIGPPIAGWIYESSGNYSIAFYLCGSTSALAACMMSCVPCLIPKHADSNKTKEILFPKDNNEANQVKVQNPEFPCAKLLRVYNGELQQNMTDDITVVENPSCDDITVVENQSYDVLLAVEKAAQGKTARQLI